MGRAEMASIISEQIRTLKPEMKSIIINTPEGITIAELYKRIEEEKTGASENTIRSTFLDLASTDGLYFDKDRKIKISSQE